MNAYEWIMREYLIMSEYWNCMNSDELWMYNDLIMNEQWMHNEWIRNE